MTIDLSADKLAAAAEFAAAIQPGQRICLTTHVNPDGDGIGSMVGLVHLLRTRGADPVIVSPTPIPPRYHFMLDGLKGVDRSPSVACIGITGQLPGKRADLLIADDIESPKNAGTRRIIGSVISAAFVAPAIHSTGSVR